MGAQGEQADSLPLTPRQLEIFGLMAKGLSNREICELLGISNNTVKIHVAAILRNLDVANRTEAVFAYKEMLEQTGASHDGRRLEVSDRIGRPAIAVLPFTNLATTEDDELDCDYFPQCDKAKGFGVSLPWLEPDPPEPEPPFSLPALEDTGGE